MYRYPLVGLAITFLFGCSSEKNPSPEQLDWPVYLGDQASSQYSPLDQINRSNVHKLSIAWQYDSGDLWDANNAQIQTNALVINGIVYGASPKQSIFALEADTGRELWRFDPSTISKVEGMARSLGNLRGISHWASAKEQRLFFTSGHYLYALNAQTGAQILSFGKQGRVDLRVGLDRNPEDNFVAATSPGIIYQNLLIQGTRVSEGPGGAPGYIRAYDVLSGEIAWTFHTIPHPGEFGYDTWPEEAYKRVGGANSWAGMSLDAKVGTVYVPTGSAAFDFWGGDRHGKNLFANCLLALDAKTGKRRWHFQFVHHDIWDRDLPAPPNLLTVKHEGRNVEAVAQVTKSGHVFVFDRHSGEPLFPIEEKPFPPSTLEGEQTWPTQPIPQLPKPISRQFMTQEDINDQNPEEHAAMLERFQSVISNGQFQPFDENGTLIFPGFDGGAEWGGAATDNNGVVYVNANEMPWIASLSRVEKTAGNESDQSGAELYQQHCATCHGIDKLGGASNPSLVDIDQHYSAEQFQQLLKVGRGFMPAFARLREAERIKLQQFVLGSENSQAEIKEALSSEQRDAEIPYVFDGYHRFTDSQGNPAIKPPWGTLNAIDLNTGERLWQVTLGELPELSAKGIAPTGTENYGGPVVTAGGLIFIAATKDEMFRAFDKKTGELLWQTKLPAGAYATPSVYMVDGVQYILIAAGGGKMGTPSGSHYLAFRLAPK
jgi:quinoprotein glucose dehydrogenase